MAPDTHCGNAGKSESENPVNSESSHERVFDSASASARNAIENLLYLYAERIDAGDFTGVGALFGRATFLDPTGRVLATGSDEIRAVFERSTKRYPDGTPGTQHVTTNMILTVVDSGRRATTRSRFTVMQALSDFPLQCIIAGSYHDEFAFEDTEGWYFTQRQMKPRLIGDLSRHLTLDLSGA
jgi:hypothetical protein